MKITYDKIADAVYIYLNKTKVFKTEKVSEEILIDKSKKGKIVGIEILDASSKIPKGKLVDGTFDVFATVK